MKKIIYSLFVMAMAAMTFVSCEDVPAPYDMPDPNGGGGSGTETVEPKGSGTLEDPFNAAAAIEYCSKLESGAESPNDVYIYGKVVSIDENYTAQYGNAKFYISEDGSTTKQFLVYRALYLGNKKYTSGDLLQEGDDVIICGKVTNYNGTYETQQNKAFLYSLNGKTEGGGGGSSTGIEVTCDKAVELTNALADGGTSSEVYTVTGYITEVVGNVSKNQQTFWMADTKDGGKVFEAYWANLPEGVSEFKAGMKVKITGNLTKYVNANTGNVTAEMKNPDVEILEDGGGGGTPSGTEINCTKAVELTNALADGGTSTEVYTVTGYITEVVGNVSKNQQTFWMADTKDGGKVFEAYWANLPDGVSEFKAGMKVKITGNLTKYVKDGKVTPEIKNATVVIIEDGGGGGGTPSGTEINCTKAVELTNALADGGTSTEVYTVTGYITEVVGNVSKNQQTFWMADTKDGGKVFEAYWANLPDGVSEFKAGMKVKITGNLTKYVKDGKVTPEIKNATVVIIEDGGGSGGGGDTPSGSGKGSGTLADPYTPVGAAEAVANLTWTSNTEYDTTGEVYVKGKISKIADKGTFTEGGSYGNASFYISKDGKENDEFYCFRVLYLGNKKFESGQTDIKVGDEVIVYGPLMNYRGKTPETVANKAYLYSLNGKTEVRATRR